jgi:hypothetical protein
MGEDAYKNCQEIGTCNDDDRKCSKWGGKSGKM